MAGLPFYFVGFTPLLRFGIHGRVLRNTPLRKEKLFILISTIKGNLMTVL
jgi:hypothetical protein